jgi:hypothetical protein
LKFLSYFWGPIPWMIEVAVILSGVVRHWPDFFIILLLLVTNAVVAFWEERQAGNEIAALKAKLAIKARVIRDGKWVNPPARELVPGDVIRLRLGDVVPADARLLAGDEVSVDQSALTGNPCPPPANRVRRCFPVRSSGAAKSVHWCMRRVKNLFWQDGTTGAGGTHRQSFSESGFEDWQLPDHPRSGAGGGDHRFRDLSG